MTDDELTAFIERVVDEKLRERDRKARRVREGLSWSPRCRGDRDAQRAELRKLNRGT
jgi:hypothetical protein